MAIFDPSENFCDREQRPGGFFDGWDRRISAPTAPRHHGPHAHRENLGVCQCLSSFFIIQIAFVFHNCIINIYVNITNSWFMQCFGGCFLCVSSYFTGEFSLKHTHWSHFWSVPAPRLWLMISTSFFLKRSLSTAHCISKNRGYLEEAGALRYQRISKGNSKILSLLICFVSVIWDDDHDHHYYYFSGWDHQPYLWKTMEKTNNDRWYPT